MPCYVVAYDLRTPGRDYTSLTKQLQSVPNCHAQGSVWFIEHPGPEATIRDVLRGHMDANDILFVSEVSKSWAGQWMPTCGAWLNQRGY